jgi:hypothetical protein
VKIEIQIPGFEGEEDFEFGWPPIDDIPGGLRPTVIDFLDAGTRAVEVSDFTYDGSFLIDGNYEDVLATGNLVTIEYTHTKDGERVSATHITTISGGYTQSETSAVYAIAVTPPGEEIEVESLFCWQDCPGWSDDLSLLYSGGGGPYSFLSFWGHPTSYTMKVYGNQDSRVPEATIDSEFTPDDEGEWLNRKPLESASLISIDDGKRISIGNKSFNINMRLKKSLEQKRSSDAAHKFECSGQLLEEKITKWKSGATLSQLEYWNRSIFGNYDLEVSEIGSCSVAHFFHSYHTGDNGAGTFALKYMPEMLEKTVLNDDQEEVQEPVNLFFSPFDTSDKVNFKLTLEPNYTADEVTKKPIKAGKKYKVLLFPRRWAYYTRTRQTTVSAEAIQAQTTLTTHHKVANVGQPYLQPHWTADQQDLIDYHLMTAHEGFMKQGPVGYRLVNLRSCVAGLYSRYCDCRNAGYTAVYTTAHTNVKADCTYEYFIDAHEDTMPLNWCIASSPCPAWFNHTFDWGEVNELTLYGTPWQQDYRIGIYWDRFPNHLIKLEPSLEQPSMKPSDLTLDSYGFDPQLNNKERDYNTNAYLASSQIYSILNGLRYPRYSRWTANIPGIADLYNSDIVEDYPLLISGLNALHMISFYTDEEPYKSGIGGSFVGAFKVGARGIVPDPPSEQALFQVPYRAAFDVNWEMEPHNPPTNRNPFILVRQLTTDLLAHLNERWVPICLGAHHNSLDLKWEGDTAWGEFLDQLFMKIAGVTPIHASEMDELEIASSNMGWMPSVRSSEFWENHGPPIYDANNKYSKWNNFPVGVGISPDKAESLVGIIVSGSTPIYVWRKTDEEFTLNKMTLPEDAEFENMEAYNGHPQSFESTFASGYSHCNDIGIPMAANEDWDGTAAFIHEYRSDDVILEYASMGFVGWADEMEYEFVDQFSGSGSRKLTHVGRDVTTELIYSPKFRCRGLDYENTTLSSSFIESSLEVVKDYRFIASQEGQHILHAPIFVMFSREKKLEIPTSKGSFATDWPYPACRVARNTFSGWGAGVAYALDPDGNLFVDGGYRNRCNEPLFPY